MFALHWRDVKFTTLEVQVLRAVVRKHVGKVKTPASKKPVPLHASVADELMRWRRESAYNADDDFLFPSVRLNGQRPVTPDTVLKKIIRPALKAAGITGKVIGWHSFRRSLVTNLRSLGALYAGCEYREEKC
jgi:integrase